MQKEPGVGKVYWGEIGGRFIKRVTDGPGFDKRKHYTIYDSADLELPKIDKIYRIKKKKLEKDLDKIWEDIDKAWEKFDSEWDEVWGDEDDEN